MEECCSQWNQLSQNFLDCFSMQDLKAKNSKSIYPNGSTHFLSAHAVFPWEQEEFDDSYLLPLLCLQLAHAGL